MKRIGFVVKAILTLAVIQGFSAPAFAQGGIASYSCHGQVSSNSGDTATLRNRARRALLVDGVGQAVADLVNRETRERLKADLRKSVYSQPDRYVQSYQIVSEDVQADSFALTGEVAVSIDLLRADLARLGALEAEPPEATAAVQPGAAAVGGTGGPAADFPEVKQPLPSSGREVLWVVTERWSSGWVLPRENDYGRSPFLLGSAREIQDYGWVLVPPRDGSLTLETGGHVLLDDVLALAGVMAIPTVIYGRATGRPVSQTATLVTADLDVIDVATRQSRGKIHQEWQAVGVNDHEAAVQLANLVVPGLDRLLAQGTGGGARPAPGSDAVTAAGAGATLAPVAPGEEVIVIRGPHPYAAWEALEALLTEHAGALRLHTLELVPNAVRAHVSGVELALFATFDGYRLDERYSLQLEQTSQQDRTVYFNSTALEPPSPTGPPESATP